MSGSLLEVKKKINGIQNTRKITKAMQLVAASKMRQFQKRALSARYFVFDLLKVLENNLDPNHESAYTEERTGEKTLFVLYTSDKGLCGALNNKLINALFRSEKWLNTTEENRMLITIGKKSNNYAKTHHIPVYKHFTGIPEKLHNIDVIDVVDDIFSAWQNDEQIQEVVFIAPHYKNSFTFYPVMKTFLPFSKEAIRSQLKVDEDIDPNEIEEDDADKNGFMIYSPSQEQVLERLYEQIVQSVFIQSFLELKASEYSSRMIAMQNATDSANRIIGSLKLIYNKARQQAITQQIAELIGASMALEDAE